MKFKSKFLLAKIETPGNEDIDAVPVGTDAVLTSELSVQIYQGDKVSRNLDKDSMGASEEVNTSPHNVLSCNVEMQGSSVAGTPPAFGEMLRVCGLEENPDITVPGSEFVEYTPKSADFESLTAYFLRKKESGQQMKVMTTGIRGNMSVELNKGAFPMFKFDNLMGTYHTPVEAGPITSDTLDYVAPIPVTRDNTPTVEVDGNAACLESFSMNMGNEVARRDAPGCRHTFIKDRKVTGSMTIIPDETIAESYFTKLESHTAIDMLPIKIVHGTTAPQIVEINLAQVQITAISESDVDGETAYQLDYTAIPTSAGDDEFSIIFK